MARRAVEGYLASLGAGAPEPLDVSEPLEIAKGVAVHWRPDPLVESVTVAAPGFINIRLPPDGRNIRRHSPSCCVKRDPIFGLTFRRIS
ncbi:hypothetical protein AMJ85_05835 [candidate division BRC1 bacterium SM23_51]|nr:MAG: hypothetical protein AMJ85_05835 [candidate division BRC1 bacterium SM23_51]